MAGVLGVLFGGCFLILAGRLVKLQVVDHGFYAAKALNQQLLVQTVSAVRGKITDRNNVPLAQSTTAWDVTITPRDIKNDAQRGVIADNLSKILGADRQTLYNQINNKSTFVVLAKKVDQSKADAISEFKKTQKIGCIGLTADSKRYYPFGNFASQLIGFTGSDDQGLSGVEAQYDSVLKGVAGRIVSVKNAKGNNISDNYADYVGAKDGNNLVLTIDEVVQHYLEADLSAAVKANNVTNKAVGIVMDVNTGEILGMATEPSFDLNDPYTVTDDSVKAKLAALSGDALTKAKSTAQQQQWRNKAISDTNQPGSVFKIITAAAALEEAKLTEATTFPDPGVLYVNNLPIHDWNNSDNGTVTFADAFEQSWNVVFAKVGLMLGPTQFFQYMRGFGLTARTGIDLPGEANSIYFSDSGPDGLNNQFNLAESSFGQGNALTPIQMITAVAAATNGGHLVTPHVVKEETDSNGNVVKTYGSTVKRQVISSQTSQTLCDLLQKEVSEGSGKNAYVAGYRIGGKTGTAQKLDSTEQGALVSSFVGVAPTDNPQYAVIVVLDDPHNSVNNYGSAIAAPVAGDIYSKILPYLGVTPVYTSAESASLDIKAPSVTGKSLTEARSAAAGAGLQTTVIGGGQTVTGQSPAGGAGIRKGGTLYIYTGGAAQQTTQVPTLTGLPVSQVESALAAAKLNGAYSGLSADTKDETADSQSYAAGTSVPIGTEVVVGFRDNKLSVDR